MENNGYNGKDVRYEYNPQQTAETSDNRQFNQGNTTYDTASFDAYAYASSGAAYDDFQKPPRKKLPKWLKILLIIAGIVILMFIILAACGTVSSKDSDGYMSEFNFGDDYVGLLYLQGTITDGDSGDGYNQQWLLNRIDQMENDSNNKGIMLDVNSPGGDVYATDELYNRLVAYKENTKRPVYVYMENMAASGGYYVSMSADKIFANKNCWTGSIGVIVGTIFDFSELMDKMGIKAVDITSGKNKGMGSSTHPLTDEQRAIYQSLVDEAFSNFVQIVMKGRDLSEEYVRQVADGRVYTAKQAKEAKLIDEISSLEEAQKAMLKEQNLEDCIFGPIQYVPEASLFEKIFGAKAEDLAPKSEYDQLFALMEKNSKFTVSYLSQVQK